MKSGGYLIETPIGYILYGLPPGTYSELISLKVLD